MALKIKAKAPPKVTETVEVKDQGKTISEDVTTSDLEDPALAAVTGQADTIQPLCEVGVDMSYTHNLGDYRSTRVAVSLKVPCVTAEINEVYDYAKDWVEERMNTLVAELQSED